MMYEELLFDMNALGDIPDKDFTSRAALAGSSPRGGRGQKQKPESPSSRAQGDQPTSGRQGLGHLLSNLWVLSHTSHPLQSAV